MPEIKKTLIKVPKRILSEAEIKTAEGNKVNVVKSKSANNDIPRAKGKIANIQTGVSSKGTKGEWGHRVHFADGTHEDVTDSGLQSLSRTVEYQDYRKDLASKKQ